MPTTTCRRSCCWTPYRCATARTCDCHRNERAAATLEDLIAAAQEQTDREDHRPRSIVDRRRS